MKRTLRITLAAVLLFAASAVPACEGEKVAKFHAVAVDRCITRKVTLSFDGPIVEDADRTFVTVSDADGRKLYQSLKDIYGGGK